MAVHSRGVPLVQEKPPTVQVPAVGELGECGERAPRLCVQLLAGAAERTLHEAGFGTSAATPAAAAAPPAPVCS